jgi:predicted permease
MPERDLGVRRVPWLDHFVQDVRCATRNIRHYPVAATVAVISLACGIGATAVTLTIRDVVFRRPPPLYRDPGRLSRVQTGAIDRPIMAIGSYAPGGLYHVWRDTIGRDMAASRPLRGVREVRTADRTDNVPVREVTSNLFEVLGVAPVMGQPLPDAARADAAPAVLSYRLWNQLFDRRADAIGRVVWIDNRPFTVVGVLPERFWFSETNSPIWTRLDPAAIGRDDPLDVVIRRPAGVTPAMLTARLEADLARYAATLPSAERRIQLKVSGIEGTPLGGQMAIALPYVLATAVLLTLLIACANVAILMIAQWTAREHEIAIRAAIGATRGRIVKALLTESALLAAGGGALGVLTAAALRAVILHNSLDSETFYDVSIHATIFVQTAIVTLLTGIVAGVAPALYETRRLHTNPLRSLAASDRVRQRWRHTLVVLEISVTMALLVVTGAMIDGYRRTRNADMGFDGRPMLTTYVENPGGVPIGPILDALGGMPGVASASAATAAPYAGGARHMRIAADAAGSNAVSADQASVTSGFFATLGVPLRAGRDFSQLDTGSAQSAIANETLARRLFQGRNAVGQRIWIGGTPHEIVGIVADYKTGPLQPAESNPKVFLPLPTDSRTAKGLHFLVRATGDPAPLVQPVRQQARDAATGSVVPRAITYDQVRTIMGQETLIGTAPLVPLIAIGTLLTAAGIYGVLAFAITRRSRELAVRVAIGASGRDIVKLVTSHAIRLVSLGVVLGLAATFALGRVVRAAGGGDSILDPPGHVLIAPALLVIAIALLATWVPSRRAVRVDPSVLLRSS